MRVLSGIQTSARLHIGNYFGMMKRMIEFQENEELFCFLSNLHALTSVFDGVALRENTLEAVADFLALGLDPDKCCFWVQSDVPEVTELTWYLCNVTPVGLLERCHSYKDKIAKGVSPNHGLFTYPVLMAADILLYQAELVPVGKDQKQHIEVARDIAMKFNNLYGEVFAIPKPAIDKEVAVIPGTDGQKMSKSYGNTVDIFSEETVIKKSVMGIVTDSTPVEAPKNPEQCTVFALYSLFADEKEKEQMRQNYIQGGYGYGQAKKELLAKVMDYFAPYREKRSKIISDKAALQAILKKGAEKARAVAAQTLQEVRKRVGVS